MNAVSEISNCSAVSAWQASSLLKIPPFPGAQISSFERLPLETDRALSFEQCIALVREQRVGGTFWAAQPLLPSSYFLVRSNGVVPSHDDIGPQHGKPLVWCFASSRKAPRGAISGDCDPWHMLAGATGLLCEPEDEVQLIAVMLGVPIYLSDPDRGPPRRSGSSSARLAETLPLKASFSSPFGGDVMSLVDIINLCGFWRALIDSNRDIAGGLGFAVWKQASVLPLLWTGGDPGAFFRDAANVAAEAGAVALWRSRVSPELIAKIEQRGTAIVEVEDGFLRSTGLGADCIPPLSITVDRLGPYFDPAQPSELEELIEHGLFGPALVCRARAIRETIVAAGLGKYGRSDATIERFDSERRHILVVGQVEDDRSVLTGGCGLSTNQELLERVRASEPNAFLVYKPHPDVVAGHRKGTISHKMGRQLADRVVTDLAISSLIDMVDEVHVNTSLAGFEALMRHKSVTTYGVPFYAGWGLTRDLGPVPARRTRRCTLDELVAATLLLYPRYLDPQSGLPCPAEVVVDRLTRLPSERVSRLVTLRRFQGWMRTYLKSWSATALR